MAYETANSQPPEPAVHEENTAIPPAGYQANINSNSLVHGYDTHVSFPMDEDNPVVQQEKATVPIDPRLYPFIWGAKSF
jgi:hypothetical protein